MFKLAGSLGVLSLAVAVPVQAQGYGDDGDHDWYVSVTGGAIFPGDSESEALSDLGVSHDIELDPGYSVRGAVGTNLQPFRIELEVGYLSTEIDDLDAPVASSLSQGGDIDALSLMVNGFWDFPINEWMDIYVGAGVGPAWVEVDSFSGTAGGVPFAIEGDDDVIVAYQAMVGAAFLLDDRWTLTAGYRLWSGEDLDFGLGEFETPLVHTAEVGVRFAF